MDTGHRLRGDIQGLRAIAVGLVLLFHVWPGAMPGGYVGVDVFFVISGYLIVGSLAREAEREGRISLLAFYSRRIRRLLPAASLVLVFVLAGMFVWLPPAWWAETLLQIGASAIYAENWYLAWAAVDYLAAENAPSPVQHYWSLSIEEQFYIVWPLVMLAALWISRSRGLAVRPILGVALGLVFLGSLATSVALTASDPGRAYFVTTTRAWELALGGMLAVWLPHIGAGPRARAALCLLGLAAILLSGLSYGGVAFPGYAALVPTLGAAAVILAGDVRLGFFRGLNMTPLRYIGDISYSLYLWHWPLIIFVLATGIEIGIWQGILLIAATVAISHVSYHHVEVRFRHPREPVQIGSLRYGFVSILSIVAVAAASYLTIARQTPAAALRSADAALYPGPAALIDGAPVPPGVPLAPPPAQLMRDRSIVYDSGCHQDQEHSEAFVCEFGDPEAVTSVAVIGSSHSVNWLPAIDVLGRKNGWKVYSITKSSCGFRNRSESCDAWHNNVLALLEKAPVDVVFVAENAGQSTTDAEQELIASRWRSITGLGIPILAVRPIPHLRTRPGDCLPDDIDRCVIPRAEAEQANSIALAAETTPNVHVIDMTNAICGPDTCGPVVGNIIVFRDLHHLTATYSHALAPILERAIVQSFPELLPVRAGELPHPAASLRRRATINCDPTKGSKPFTRSYALVLEDDRIVLRRGDWQSRKDNFEEWEGGIVDGAITITGEYREGQDIKQVRLEGSIEDGAVVAHGQRGPRKCSLRWPLDEEQMAN